MGSSVEYILFASMCFFPFMLFAYYPLRYFKRFDMKVTVLLELVASLIEIIFFTVAFQFFADMPIWFVVIIVIFNPLAYKLIYKVNMGRILFNLLMVVNYANFTVIAAKFMEILVFPKMAVEQFHWTYSLCVLVMEVVFILPITYFTKHFSDDMIKDNSFDFIWRFVWLLPLAFSALGFIMFFVPGQCSASRIRFYMKSTIFCGLIVGCQMMIYYYIAKMIRQQQIVRKLESDIYHHSLQQVQYRKIEEQIKETRILRHDLRHHVTLMCHYLEGKEYDKLDEYLHQYSQSINRISTLHYTDHSVLNALLVYYADLCRTKEITFDVKMFLPEILPLNDSEITTVFGNLLENAYQACLEMEDESARSIQVCGTLKAHRYLFIVDNTYRNALERDHTGNFLTTKPHGNGIGILSVKEIIEIHDGYVRILTNKQHFEVSISIPE